MITYEVSATIADPAVAAKYEHYMQAKHVRDVLACGCFIEAMLERSGPGKYRTRYMARSQDDVDRYLRDHTATLRKDFAEHFPTGVQLAREVWTSLASQSPADPANGVQRSTLNVQR